MNHVNLVTVPYLSSWLTHAPNMGRMQEYKDVFEPLLLEECCSQIMRGMEEGEVLVPHRAVAASSEMVGTGSR